MATYDFGDPEIEAMVQRGHYPEERWDYQTTATPVRVLKGVHCAEDYEPWPCQAIQQLRRHSRDCDFK